MKMLTYLVKNWKIYKLIHTFIDQLNKTDADLSNPQDLFDARANARTYAEGTPFIGHDMYHNLGTPSKLKLDSEPFEDESLNSYYRTWIFIEWQLIEIEHDEVRSNQDY